MKTRLLTIAAALLFMLTAGGMAQQPITRAVAIVQPSIVRLDMPMDIDPEHQQMGSGFCTGFVVAPTVVLTDMHCIIRSSGFIVVDEKELVSSAVADSVQDLAVLRVDTGSKPPASFRLTAMPDDAEVYALGYGFGYDRPVSTINSVLWQHYGPDNKQIGLFLRGELVHGMSGGPIFDKDGKVIGIVQQTIEGISYAQDAFHLMAFVKAASAMLPPLDKK